MISCACLRNLLSYSLLIPHQNKLCDNSYVNDSESDNGSNSDSDSDSDKDSDSDG